ncbi:MAG: retroviral-like aspartic protease family protein [Saprospiraceae bacterium]
MTLKWTFSVFFIFFFSFLYGNKEVIPFKLIQNLIIIEADFDKVKGNFIVDTGSDAVFVNQNASTSNKKSETFNTLNGQVASFGLTIKRLQVGNITKHNLDAYYTNLSNLEKFLSVDIAGIVGTDVFSPHSLYFDFESNFIHVLKDSPNINDYSLKNELSFYWTSGLPVTDIKIGQQEYCFILDSGASIHIFDNSLVQNHKSFFTSVISDIAVETLGSNEPSIASKYTVSSLDIGSASLQNLSCLVQSFDQINETNTKKISGILSISRLSLSGVLVDFHHKKLYF